MVKQRHSVPRGVAPGVALALAFLLSACSTPQIDWNSRVGTFTYDQAVIDLGPPDKSARLTDGSTVADWLTRRGSPGGSGYVYGSGLYGGGYGPYGPYRPYGYYGYYGGPAYYVQTPTPDHFLRLTFGPDGQLQAWKKVAR